MRRQRLYEKFLKPALEVYRLYGLPAELKEPADIVAGGSKCSGNAAGDVGECVAYVGNLLLDFDFNVMSGLLRAPGPDFRACLRAALREHMTTLADWLTELPDYDQLSAALAAGFAEEFGPLNPCLPDSALRVTAERLKTRLTDEEWLRLPGRRHPERRIKIAEGVYLLERRCASGDNRIALLRDGGTADLAVCPDDSTGGYHLPRRADGAR